MCLIMLDNKICTLPEDSISQILIYIHTEASIAGDLAKWLQRGGMPKPLQAKLLAFYYH